MGAEVIRIDRTAAHVMDRLADPKFAGARGTAFNKYLGLLTAKTVAGVPPSGPGSSPRSSCPIFRAYSGSRAHGLSLP